MRLYCFVVVLKHAAKNVCVKRNRCKLYLLNDNKPTAGILHCANAVDAVTVYVLKIISSL